MSHYFPSIKTLYFLTDKYCICSLTAESSIIYCSIFVNTFHNDVPCFLND